MTDIAVNKSQFDAISEEERLEIKRGLVEVGSIREEDEIIGDSSVPEFNEETSLAPLWNPIKDGCKALCDITAGAALAWCTANTAGIGLAVCLAAAEAARQECKDRC